MNIERALISCVSQDAAVVGAEVLSIFQHDNPFVDEVCKRVYHAWAVQKDRNKWNTTAVLEKLKDATFECDWFTELRSVMNTEPSTANWRSHLEAVRLEYTRREASKELEHALYLLKGTTNVQTLLGDVSKKLVSIDTSSEEEKNVDDAISEEVERRRSKSGITIGYDKIDRYVSKLSGGQVFIIASRPSVGKSAVAVNLARKIAEKEIPVGVINLEMETWEFIERMASPICNIDNRFVLDNYQTNEEATKAIDYVKSLPIHYDDRAGLKSAQIVNKIRRWHTNHKIGAVFIDYIQLIGRNHARQSKNEVIDDALKDIKQVCKELNIVPFILAQINRGVRENADGAPKLENLKDCGGIEDIANVVMLLHRDINLSPEDEKMVEDGGAVELHYKIAKNRSGPTGYNSMAYFPRTCYLQDNYVKEQDIPK